MPHAREVRSGGNILITQRDLTLLSFLVRYRFAYAYTLARLVNSTEASIVKRLRQLAKNDLLRSVQIVRGAQLWVPTRTGLDMLGSPFPYKEGIPLASVQHTVAVTNIAAELEREHSNSKQFLTVEQHGAALPGRHRFPSGVNLYGELDAAVDLTFGEMTLSEKELMRARRSTYEQVGERSEIASTRYLRDAAYEASKDPSAPELREGNEALFIVYGEDGKTGERVPDVVVTRPWSERGAAEHGN